MLIKTKIQPADLLIVFGTTYKTELFVENIVSLYKKNLFKKILLTGGAYIKNNKKIKESIFLKRMLIKNNVDKNIILTESKSKNTYENLKFSIPILLDSFGEIKNIKSIIGLGKNFASRRFLMTMCKFFPFSKKMFFPINIFGCEEEYWYLNDEFYKKLMLEQEKCNEYLKKGFIAKLDNSILF